MSRFDYNNLLFQISKKLDEINVVEQIRVLCRELVAASHTTTFPLFEELEEKGYLSSDHLEVLKAMLRNVKEWNLLDDVKKFEYNRKEYDNLLGQVIRVFDGPNDLERLLLICKESIPEEGQASIHSVRSLLKELENNQRLGIYCLGTLKEILTHTEKRDLLKEVEGFEQRQSRDLEFEKRKEQAAAITSSAIEKLAGVLNVKTVFKVAVGGLTIASSLAMLTRDSTYDQLILAVNTCVLPAGATLIQISDGCVCLKVQVESLAALETLWSLYQGGTLKETLQALLVTDEMRDLAIAGGKQIEAIVTIDEQEYEKVRNKLANQAQEDPDGKGERRLKYLNQEKYDYVQSYLEQIKDVDSHSVSDSGFCGSITSSSEVGTEDTNEDDPSHQEERSENHSPKQTFQQLKESVTPLPPTVSKSGTSELHTTAQKRPASFEKPSRKEHEESKATQIRQTSQGARPKERNSVTTESNDKAGKDVDGNEKEQTFGSHLPKQTLQQRGFSPLPERVAKSVTPVKSELNTSLSKVPTPTPKESFEGPKRKVPEERTTAQIRPVSQEARPKERSSVTTESTPKGTKDLAILGCCVSKRYITDAIHAIESVRPTLNLHAQPSDFTSLVQVKRHLEGHSLQFCVLVVNGEAIRDAYGNQPERRDEYEDLLKTAVERVAEKVVIVLCGTLSLSGEDKTIVHRNINRTVKEQAFIAWLKNGRLTEDSGVQAQLPNPASAMMFVMPPSSRRGGIPPTTPSYTKYSPLTGKLVLKSKLRYGKISFAKADLEYYSPDAFQKTSEDDCRILWEKGRCTAETKIKVMLVRNESVVYIGDQGTEMADNDLLLLKTRVNKGLVSFQEDDIEFLYPNWEVPTNIIEDLRSKKSNGKLFIISDEKGNLRCRVESSIKDNCLLL